MRCILLHLLSLVAAYEWAGTFETPDDLYVWTAQSVDGEYVDPTMKLVLLPASGSDKATLESLVPTGSAAIEGTCIDALQGSTLTPAASTACYRLIFDTELHTSTFKINASAVSNIAFFAEHVPTEFERDAHYLKDSAGDDIEPIAELPEPAELSKPWGVAIGAACIVNILTFIGIVFLVPACGKIAVAYPTLLSVTVNAFAAGALLAAAFYLMFYEATHLIKPEGSTESEQTALWGSMALLGFLTAYIIDLLISYAKGVKDRKPSQETPSTATTATTATSGAEEDKGEAHEVEEAEIHIAVDTSGLVGEDVGRQSRVVGGILIGDFMHNLVDGIFIGFGFLGCGSSIGWTITGATIAHEIAQEIADYLVLTDPHQGNLPPWKALVCNFVSGTSVIFGVIIILAQGAEDNLSMGMLLAYGGGIYLHIGAGECMPRAVQYADSSILRVVVLLLFAVGVTAIGVVLTSHEHCAPDGGHSH